MIAEVPLGEIADAGQWATSKVERRRGQCQDHVQIWTALKWSVCRETSGRRMG